MQQFVINDFSPEHIGSYKCEATNPGGSESINFKVSMKERADVIKAEEITENSFDDKMMRLSCTVKGFPLPIISWGSNTSVLISTDTVDVKEIFTRAPTSVLYLNERGREMTSDDFTKFIASDEQYYSELTKLDGVSWKIDIIFKDKSTVISNTFVCAAQNAHGRAEKAVKTKSVQALTFGDGKGAEVYHTVELDQQLDLDCDIDGTPPPLIRWSFVSLAFPCLNLSNFKF